MRWCCWWSRAWGGSYSSRYQQTKWWVHCCFIALASTRISPSCLILTMVLAMNTQTYTCARNTANCHWMTKMFCPYLELFVFDPKKVPSIWKHLPQIVHECQPSTKNTYGICFSNHSLQSDKTLFSWLASYFIGLNKRNGKTPFFE